VVTRRPGRAHQTFQARDSLNARSRSKLLAPVDLRAGIVGAVVGTLDRHRQGLAIRRDFHGARFRRHAANLAGTFDGIGVVAFDRDGIEAGAIDGAGVAVKPRCGLPKAWLTRLEVRR
jgi:hypothetical protein